MMATETATRPVLAMIVDLQPDRVLSPNARVPWQTSWPAVQDAKLAAYFVARRVLGEHIADPMCFQRNPQRIRWRALVCWGKGRRRMDEDNLVTSLKPYLDGVAEALGVNDRRFQVDYVAQNRDPRGLGNVQFMFWQEEADQPELPRLWPGAATDGEDGR